MRYILLIKSGYIIQVIIGNEGMDQVTYFFPILFVMKIHVHPILVSEGYQGCDSQPYISNQWNKYMWHMYNMYEPVT